MGRRRGSPFILKSASVKRVASSVGKADPRGEHAVVVVRRRPDGLHGSRRDELARENARPEGAAHRARVGLAVEDGPEHVDLAGPGVSMLSEVGVEAARLVVPALDQPCLGEEVHREDRRVAAVTAPEGEAPSAEVRQLPDPAPRADDDLRSTTRGPCLASPAACTCPG